MSDDEMHARVEWSTGHQEKPPMLFGITLILFVTLALFTPAILAAIFTRGMDDTDTHN